MIHGSWFQIWFIFRYYYFNKKYENLDFVLFVKSENCKKRRLKNKYFIFVEKPISIKKEQIKVQFSLL